MAVKVDLAAGLCSLLTACLFFVFLPVSQLFLFPPQNDKAPWQRMVLYALIEQSYLVIYSLNARTQTNTQTPPDVDKKRRQEMLNEYVRQKTMKSSGSSSDLAAAAGAQQQQPAPTPTIVPVQLIDNTPTSASISVASSRPSSASRIRPSADGLDGTSTRSVSRSSRGGGAGGKDDGGASGNGSIGVVRARSFTPKSAAVASHVNPRPADMPAVPKKMTIADVASLQRRRELLNTFIEQKRRQEEQTALQQQQQQENGDANGNDDGNKKDEESDEESPRGFSLEDRLLGRSKPSGGGGGSARASSKSKASATSTADGAAPRLLSTSGGRILESNSATTLTASAQAKLSEIAAKKLQAQQEKEKQERLARAKSKRRGGGAAAAAAAATAAANGKTEDAKAYPAGDLYEHYTPPPQRSTSAPRTATPTKMFSPKVPSRAPTPTSASKRPPSAPRTANGQSPKPTTGKENAAEVL